MDSFEEAFDNATKVADLALKANQDLLKQLRRLRKASQDGNITAVKREQGRLSEALSKVSEAVSDASVAWSYDDGEEVQYLRADDGYAAELRRVASEKGLVIRERDGQLICHPFIVRIIPGERAVRIDKKKVSAIRPSHLTEVLVKAQKSPPRYRPQSFPRGAAQGLSISDQRILNASHRWDRRPRYSSDRRLQTFHLSAWQR